MKTLTELAEMLKEYGGSIVSTASLSAESINQARAAQRMYVDDEGFGFVWEPNCLLPTSEEEVQLFEKWYPIPIEIPEYLKKPDFIFKAMLLSNDR